MTSRWRTVVTVGVCAVVGAGAVLATVNGGRGGGDSATMSGGSSVAGDATRATASTDAGAGGSAPANVRDETGATDGGAATGLGALPTPTLRAHVVQRATLELEVGRKQGKAAVRDVINAVDVVGGFVQSSDQSDGRARLTVRVPSDQFAATLERLEGFGRERTLEVHGEDVTGAVTDVAARLRNLRAQEGILLELMRRAVSIGDSIAVQQQLSQNQEQIEQLEGQKRVLDDQTTFATLVVTITPTGAPAAGTDDSSNLADAWEDAVGAAVAVLGGTLVVLGALLPIVMLAGLGALVWLAVVRLRRPRAANADAAAR